METAQPLRVAPPVVPEALRAPSKAIRASGYGLDALRGAGHTSKRSNPVASASTASASGVNPSGSDSTALGRGWNTSGSAAHPPSVDRTLFPPIRIHPRAWRSGRRIERPMEGPRGESGQDDPTAPGATFPGRHARAEMPDHGQAGGLKAFPNPHPRRQPTDPTSRSRLSSGTSPYASTHSCGTLWRTRRARAARIWPGTSSTAGSPRLS